MCFSNIMQVCHSGSITEKDFFGYGCVKNYRPVSNLAYVGKLVEKVVVGQLNQHRDENGLHQVNQSAYCRHHSTETALEKITNDILLAMDIGQ